jgi:hypothetical protein
VRRVPNESFAMTMARALGIGTRELGVRMRDGTFGRDLWNKFGDVNTAADKSAVTLKCSFWFTVTTRSISQRKLW